MTLREKILTTLDDVLLHLQSSPEFSKQEQDIITKARPVIQHLIDGCRAVPQPKQTESSSQTQANSDKNLNNALQKLKNSLSKF